jgi:hypothetical protein
VPRAEIQTHRPHQVPRRGLLRVRFAAVMSTPRRAGGDELVELFGEVTTESDGPALVPRSSHESGHSAGIRGQWRSSPGNRRTGETPGQGRSCLGGECGASWNRTSGLTLIRGAL